MIYNTPWYVVLVLLLFVSCSDTETVEKNRPSVFVSIAPQAYLLEEICGEAVDVSILIQENQNPHTFELTPKQMVEISHADAYFHLDLPFEKAVVTKIQDSFDDLRVINAAVTLRDHLIEMEHHDHCEEGHDHGDENYDPHIWLSPLFIKEIAATMLHEICAIDKENNPVFLENFIRLSNRIDAVHSENQQKLAPYKNRGFYVFHPAFGYFAEAYQLRQIAVELGGKSPSPKQIDSFIEQAKEDQARILFVQPQFDTHSADIIAKAIQGRVVPIDPMAKNVLQNLATMAEQIHLSFQDAE
jgi:zinc transport system substrate-binding protein